MKKQIGIVLLALVIIAAAAPITFATDGSQDELAEIRRETARYHDLDVALADGYEALFECIVNPNNPGEAMGQHYINFGLLDDVVEVGYPEVLMYEQQPNGRMKLIGVEFIIFQAAWASTDAPEFLGQTLALKSQVGTHPVDPFYELHAWVWKHNPSGIFADWNPEVSCATS